MLFITQYSSEEASMDTAIGMPSRNRQANEIKKTASAMVYASFSPRLAASSPQVSLMMLLTM